MKMDENFLTRLISPVTGSELVLKNDVLTDDAGNVFPVIDGIPSLLTLTDREKNTYAMDHFKKLAADYDTHYHLNFETFYQKEDDVRNAIIDKLRLQPSYCCS